MLVLLIISILLLVLAGVLLNKALFGPYPEPVARRLDTRSFVDGEEYRGGQF
jgi:hypothetical protein